MATNRHKRVAVIGAGLMGHGIALEYALHGHEVRLRDVSDERLDWALERVHEGLGLLREAGKVDGVRAKQALARIRMTTNLAESVEGAAIVVEAAFEDLELKRRLYRDIERLAPTNTILASNTSTFMPSRLAEGLTRPDRLLVTHYFNPPYLVPLVEIVAGGRTDVEVVTQMSELLASMGKRPVLVKREAPGFIGNRLQAALFREAIHLIEQGVASAEDIDTVVTTGFGRRLAHVGPFMTGDFAGWDLFQTILAELQPSLCSSAAPSPVLAEKVARGELGAKTGAGFYKWKEDRAAAARRKLALRLAEMLPNGRDVARS